MTARGGKLILATLQERTNLLQQLMQSVEGDPDLPPERVAKHCGIYAFACTPISWCSLNHSMVSTIFLIVNSVHDDISPTRGQCHIFLYSKNETKSILKRLYFAPITINRVPSSCPLASDNYQYASGLVRSERTTKLASWLMESSSRSMRSLSASN